MRVHYIKEEQIYLIANHCVAKNAIFRKLLYRKRLETKLRDYLSPICDVISIVIHGDQFQLVIKTRSREAFKKFYINQQIELNKEVDTIPESTYIFSQVMANVQSGAAIHFNRQEDRTGAVFARRFIKILIDGEENLNRWLRRFRDRIKLHVYVGRWSTGLRKASKMGLEMNKENENRTKFRLLNNRLQGRTIIPIKKHTFYLFSSLAAP